MRTNLGLAALACAILVCVSATSRARSVEPHLYDDPHGSATPASRADTLWIFDADFEDLTGDNAGWVSEDLSERPARVNYWHKDTIRINGFEHLGDSTWWCGTYNDCWRQPRGYGNNWVCDLIREVQLGALTAPGDEITLEWDQRVAMEQDYDYGYVDISTDGGSGWTTEAVITNPGFQSPGISQDWDSELPGHEGHQSLDLSGYAGVDVALRFRFESDGAYSSEDQYDNPPVHSVQDGAWQLDNILITAVTAQAGSILVFLDDCESPGDNGWVHDDLPAEGQTGVVFERHFESFDGHSGWMMAAYDSLSGTMVDGQYSRLRSPHIDISGAPELIIQWDGWYDLGTSTEDLASLILHSSHEYDCLVYGGAQGVWYELSGGPAWVEDEFQTAVHAGKSWLGLEFRLRNYDPIGTGHGLGLAVDRARVGVPIGTSVPDGESIVSEIAAIRPNPFNPLTTVEFAVAVKGSAALRVYDVAGRLVTTLRDGEFEPGEYETTWDGTDDSGERVASGVYMFRLEVAGGASASMKAVLLE